MTNGNTVFGVFKTGDAAQETIESLANDGFIHSEISILCIEHGDPAQSRTRILDKTLELLEGARILSIPGFGAIIAAGPSLNSLHHVDTIYQDGWLRGPLTRQGLAQHNAQLYENLVKQGSVLLSVRCINEKDQQKAEALFNQNGARGLCILLGHSSDDEWQSPDPKDFFQQDNSTAPPRP